jgi:hypothetical protein
MALNPTWSTRSSLSIGCFYIACYLGFGAACALTYQWVEWLRTGYWITPQMSQILVAIGRQHPPSLGWPAIQPLIDSAWRLIGDCPISICFSIAAGAVALLGISWRAISSRRLALRDAH